MQPPKPLRSKSSCSEKSSDANRDRKIHCSLIPILQSLNFSVPNHRITGRNLESSRAGSRRVWDGPRFSLRDEQNGPDRYQTEHAVPASEVVKIDVSKLTDEILKDQCLPYVKRLYKRFGGNDEAGKNPKMAAALGKWLIKTYSPPHKSSSKKGA